MNSSFKSCLPRAFYNPSKYSPIPTDRASRTTTAEK